MAFSLGVGFSSSLRDAQLELVRAALNAGATGAVVKIYDDTEGKVATGEPMGTQVLLATLTCAEDCGAVANGELVFASITSDTQPDASGVPSIARFEDSDGNFVMDVDITTESLFSTLFTSVDVIVPASSVSIEGFVLRNEAFRAFSTPPPVLS